MPSTMRSLSLALLLALGSSAWAGEARVIPAEEWLRPRSGAGILDSEVVQATVREWMAAEGTARIVIEYPGGEQGELWASELRDWLITLGIPAGDLSLRPAGSPEGLTLLVEPRDGRS